jgi:hypothetical protein
MIKFIFFAFSVIFSIKINYDFSDVSFHTITIASFTYVLALNDKQSYPLKDAIIYCTGLQHQVTSDSL